MQAVSTEEANIFAAEFKMKYLEVSAKGNVNVTTLFEVQAQELINFEEYQKVRDHFLVC